MIVLHAIWDHLVSGKLHIWAETSGLVKSVPKRAGRQSAKQQAPLHPLHPFALAQGPLKEALGALAGNLVSVIATTDTLTLLMPSTARGPLSSPELILESVRDDQEAPTFKPWSLATLALDPGLALDFLLALPNQPPMGIAFGSSLRFWAEAARLAFEFVARQCYAPTLQEQQQRGTPVFRAAWEAVLAGEDIARVSLLAKAMPPVCWAFLPTSALKSSLPQAILHDFLNRTIDAFVRGSLRSTTLLPTSRSSSNRRSKALALPAQWLQALAAEDPTLTAPAAELKRFASTLHAWLDQLQPTKTDAPFRTCFRLDAPSEDSKNGVAWHVSFHLQANDDPSLLVPAEQVWKERSSTLTFLKRKFENPQERLLADLGKASRLFPSIEESLRTARPDELKLNTEQAYAFLRESAPLLEQSGFGVLVPPWWQKPTARLGVKLKLKPKVGDASNSGLLGLRNIVNYDWTIAIGDTTLSVKEFESLVNLKVPLIKVRGQWVELRPEEIEAAIAFFKKKHGNGSMSLGEALRIGLGQGTSELGLPVMDIEGDGWIKDLLDGLTENAKLAMIAAPPTLHGTLRPYQLKGFSWLAFLEQFGFGACLADDMGLGKCLVASSLVAINGTLQKAEDIWSCYTDLTFFDGVGHWATPTKQLLINSINEATGQIVQAPIRKLYRQQVHEQLRKIQLEDGSSVTITYPHKLLTDKGWTNDLHTGDYVCVPARLVWKGQPADPDLVKFLAWQIAEGYEIRDKCIPDFIMQADLDSIRIFLRNFFEAEASVVASMKSIEISTASPLLIQQLSYLLRRFGIWMRISTKQKRATNGSGIFRPYQFGVLGGNAARKFSQEIGFVSERKQLRLEKICELVSKTQLQHLINQEVYYCKIKEIAEIEYDGWVYDFEVENHHNFVANNILCHNTVQFITLLLHERENIVQQRKLPPSPALLICPMSIVGNWHKELQRFAPSLSVMIHHGNERLSGEAFQAAAQQHDIVITTYSLALRDKEHLAPLEWEYVVVDEAQNIKNDAAKQTQAIKHLNARHKIALTGTPVENRLSELWSIMEFLNPGYLGSGADFRKSFAIPIERYHDADRAESLKRLIQPFVLRRLKTDKSIIADLPDKLEMKVFCNLTQEQASLYEAVVKEMLEKIEEAEGIERKGLVLSTLLRLKQICNHPAQFVADGSSLPGRSGKLARLEEMLEEALATGDKALIFTQFAEMGKLLRHYLQERLGCEALFLHGGTVKKQRDAMVQRFQEERRGAPIFILSLKAGGVGLNLTAANHVFHFDRWWNPAVENQATDRAFRIGQTKNVQVHKFVCIGTLEERIDLMIEQKKELAESIVGSGESWLTEMSTTQLKELFALSREAVGE